MPYENKTTRENKAADLTGKERTAAERQTLREHVAASGKSNPGPNTYLPHVADVSAEVDSQMKAQRGK